MRRRCQGRRDPPVSRNLFRATIDLIFVKGSTNNPGLAHSVEVEEFDDPSLNCLHPMKLLLCHALRTGAVRETSWAELRQAARERPSNRVIWAYPNRPVICAIAGDSKLTLDRPSPVASAQATLTQAAQLIGIAAKVKTHDIRRGAARQSAHLENSISGSTIEQARIAIGHSHSSRDSGEIEDYVGHLDDHNWTNRAKQKLRQTAKYQLIFASEPEMGLDPHDKKDRMRASQRSRAAGYDKWVASERAKADIRVPQTTALVKLGKTLEMQALHDYIFDGDTESLTNIDEIASVFTQDVEAISCAVAGNIIDADPKAFSDFFASVNVCRWEYNVPGLPSSADQTGSKEVSTRFMHQCTVTLCARIFFTRARRDEHNINCQADDAQSFEFTCSIYGKKYPTEEKVKVHMAEHNWTPRACSWPGCQDETVHQARNQLRAHTARAHQDLPTDCWLCDAKYEGPLALKRQIRRQHPEVTEEELDNIMPIQKRQAHKQNAFKPRRCSFPNCPYQTIFGSRSQYRDHLKNHGDKGSTLDQYVQDNPEELRPNHASKGQGRQF
ncbi:C2H2-type domain-containing protein [Fusarium falciforme]|uniref:C2H2-type domain-containing protein n=1 Tax=Fusarium falciforme TaxID=195108 RepID=UPI002300B13E|nr:C2H2-type domain-containing protein [Fusarium falciforme]WAO84110.1 C2H2-type domain-containing protein [Fusarium falciforme]